MQTMKPTDRQSLRIDMQAGKPTHTQLGSVDVIRRLIRRLELEASTQRGDDPTTRAASRALSAVLTRPLTLPPPRSRR